MPISLALLRASECRILLLGDYSKPILDLGCGDGDFADLCFKEKIQIDVGLDLDEKEIKIARQKNYYKKLVCASGSGIPYPSGYFKTIISNSVLEHIEDLDDVLKETRRVLNQNGTFICTVATTKTDEYLLVSKLLKKLGLPSLAKNFIKKKHKIWKHHNIGDRKYWEGRFKKNGFEIVKIDDLLNKATIGLSDFFYPFSAPSYFFKKVFKKMIIFRPDFLSEKLSDLLYEYFEDDINGKGAALYFELIKK